MAAISRSYAGDADIEGVWATPTRTTLSGTTEEFSADIDLETSGYIGVEIDVGILFDTSPTDDVDINVYRRMDSSWDGQEIAIMSQRIAAVSNDEVFVSLNIEGGAHIRLGFQQTGATDSHDVRARANRWQYDG